MNLGDVSKIDLDKLKDLDIDLITHGSPCQDFSVAGLQAGGDKDTGTRSSLMWCTVDIVKKVKPKYVIWENVKNLLSNKHRHNFDSYIEVMESLGYNNYFKVLNAKDYGIPQNRERVYTISILKELDKGYEFPEKQELKLRLRDILEDEVEEKYYLSAKMLEGFEKHNKKHKEKGTGFIWKPKTEDDIASTLRANGALCPTDNTIKVIGKCDIKEHDCIKRVYDTDGLAPTLTDMQGGHRQPKILEYPYIAASRGRNPDDPGDRTPGIPTEQRLEINKFGVSNTITTVQKDNYVVEGKYKIRKLTPRECFKLMGFGDEDFDKAQAVPTSDTQLYKQAGNSIVVNVLEAIFKNLFKVKKSWYR